MLLVSGHFNPGGAWFVDLAIGFLVLSLGQALKEIQERVGGTNLIDFAILACHIYIPISHCKSLPESPSDHRIEARSFSLSIVFFPEQKLVNSLKIAENVLTLWCCPGSFH